MDSNERATDLSAEQIPEDLAEAGLYPDARNGFEHGLVVLSMGLPYWLLPSESGYRLMVEAPSLTFIRTQLDSFDRESLNWPPAAPVPYAANARVEWKAPLFWALVLVAVFILQNSHPNVWETRGALDAQALFDRGEAWRVFTALFLHADISHLSSNLVFGMIVFSAVATGFGRIRSWFLLFTAACCGNLAVAGINYSEPYRSLGASTAVFAGLGLLTGRAIAAVRLTTHPHRLRAILIPFMSGLSLLAFLGSGGLRTDIAAHAMGFASGLAVGFLASLGKPKGEA